MSKLISLIRRAPKRFSAVVLMVAAAIIVPAAVFAWGPDRQTFTIDTAHPENSTVSDHVTFNSITNNPNVGDERNFVVVKDAANTADGGWQDSVTVQPGKEYLVRMYVHNNAASSLNLTATNTRVSATVPTTIGKNVPLSGFVSADNAYYKDATGTNILKDSQGNTQRSIWDDISFNSTQDFSIAYVPGSAEIWNNGYAKTGKSLPDSIVTSTGAQVGYEGANGNVPGCFQYANYVYFKVKPQFGLNFTLTKQVSKHGENKFVEDYKAQPGEVVDYLLKYKNTGDTRQNDVTYRDVLPTGMTYVNGSASYANTSHPTGTPTNDNVTGVGVNVGDYLPGANSWFMFSAKVPSAEALPLCGPNLFVNTGKVTTTGYTVSDTANVTVDKACQPGKITVCELSTKKPITINESDFDAKKHSKDLSVCVELPQTGTTENIVAIVGLGALIASIVYFVASRRALNQ